MHHAIGRHDLVVQPAEVRGDEFTHAASSVREREVEASAPEFGLSQTQLCACAESKSVHDRPVDLAPVGTGKGARPVVHKARQRSV